jgi:glyoxylase-like metal-dependent hydrolase (beta-lactamase superfamily II)
MTGVGLPEYVRHLLAPNPSPMTLDGTNTWIIDGRAAVDPGPLDEGHLRAIGPVSVVLRTHNHVDHVEGIPRLLELTGAQEVPAEKAGDEAKIDGLTVIPSPGHTRDSVSFLLDRGGDRVILTGDTILGRGSSVVMWPDGDVGAYLATLRKLSGLVGVPVLPGHGPVLPDCAVAATWLLEHRLERLEQVKGALERGAETAEDVVAMVYADTPLSLRVAAEWSVRAQLEYLRSSP